MKKTTSSLLASILCLTLAGCSTGGSAGTEPSGEPESDKISVGIVQLVAHPALDEATRGFREVLEAEFGDGIEIHYQEAAGDSTTCVTIASTFVNEKVDLIMANATPALQAAASATNEIPILGTSITEYGVALDLTDFNGTVGGNISGTSDLAPLDQQAAMFGELLPDAKKIGILYCNAEANSVYQAEVVKAELEKAGKTVTVYRFTDTNDVAAVTQQAVSENDALYIPTDNTAASCTEAINNVAQPAGIPIICGEEGITKGCGIATLSINYYDLGRTTGEMAVRILKGESISDMPIEYFQNPVKKYDVERCKALGINIPDGYEPIE